MSAFVTLDVIWRFPATLLRYVPDWVAPLLSVGAGLSGSAVLASASTWLLFGMTFYFFADRIYPDSLRLPTDSRGFRLLVAAVGVGSGLTFTLYEGRITLLWVSVVLCALGGVLVVLYLHYVEGWSLFDSDGPITGPLEQVNDEATAEYDRMLHSDSPAAPLEIAFFLFATGLLTMMPCLLLGILARILVYAYPLPDLLAIGFVVASVGGQSRRTGPQSLLPEFRTLDIEERLHSGLSTTTKGFKGMMLTINILGGTILAAGTLTLAMVLGSQVFPQIGVPNSGAVTFDQVLGAWVLFGTFVLLLAAGTYGLWTWLREFRRLSQYVDRYEGDEAQLNDRVEPPRPVGAVLPPAIILLTIGLYVETYAHRAFALVWPVAAIGVGICIWLTRRRTATLVQYEGHVIVGSFLLHSAGLVSFVYGGTVIAMVRHQRLPIEALVRSPIPTLVLLTIALAYVDDAGQYSSRFDDIRRHAELAYLSGFGVLAWFITRPTAPGIQLIGTATLLLTVGGSALSIAIDTLNDEGTADSGTDQS